LRAVCSPLFSASLNCEVFGDDELETYLVQFV
jgi:hypothetical protein